MILNFQNFWQAPDVRALALTARQPSPALPRAAKELHQAAGSLNRRITRGKCT